MLEAFIIEELERRERSTYDTPFAQPSLPLEPLPEEEPVEHEEPRGRVIVIDMT